MRHFNLEEFAGGLVSAQVNRALHEVTENILDPNTDETKARKIVVTINMKPSANRSIVNTNVSTKTTLAPSSGIETTMSVGKDLNTGEVECVEIGHNQIPGQLVFRPGGQEGDVESFDPSTGEIFDTAPKNDNVIDLRNAK